MRRSVSFSALAALMVSAPAILSACTDSRDLGDVSPKPPEQRITVWTRDTESRIVAGTKRIVAGFTTTTGIEVDLVPVGTRDVRHLLQQTGKGTATAAAERELPDVIGGLPLSRAHALAARGLIDPDAVARVLGELGRDTFEEAVLRRATRRGDEVAVPSDAWIHVLVYRRDLFARAGLPVPDTFGKLRQAAQKLDSTEMAGIAVPAATESLATARTFEHFALANGCRVLAGRTVSLDSRECVATFAFYADLAAHGPDARDARAARKAYLSGEAAMMLASSAVLDDLGGLDQKNAPTCDPCRADPAFLAKNSGVVTAIRGPEGTRPVQYGVVSSWTITNAAEAGPAREFVTYMMGRGYLEWLGIAPGGRLPVRMGTADRPEKFVRAWARLPAGSENAASLSSLYPQTVLDLLRASPGNMRRWGEGAQASLVVAMRGSLPIATQVRRMLDEDVTATEAAERSGRAVRRLLEEVSPSHTASP